MTLFATFPDLPEPVALADDPALSGCLQAVLNGWRFELSAGDGRLPFATIDRRRRGYRLTSRWLDEPSKADTPVGAITSLVVDLGYTFAAAAPGRLCLHAGAVDLGGRLVVFPSASKAGKSTLIAALAMAGVRIFADDLLPIEGASTRAIALGTRPRLRLPLARGAGEDFRRFVRAHAGPADDEQQFLNLPPELHASHGEIAPLGAFVLLDRRREGPAELAAAGAGAGLRSIILQNLATPAAADAVFGRLRALVEEFPCFTLRYARLDDAVGLLRERFTDWSAGEATPLGGSEAAAQTRHDRIPFPSLRSAGDDTGDVPGELQYGEGRGPGHLANAPKATASDPAQLSPSLSRGGRGIAPDRSAVLPASVTKDHRFRQNPAATLHEVGGEAFLVHPGCDGIYALDPMARLVWALLEAPVTSEDIAGVLAELFPDAEPARIRRDVGGLLRDLAERGLVVPAGARPKKKGAPRGRPRRRTSEEAQTE